MRLSSMIFNFFQIIIVLSQYCVTPIGLMFAGHLGRDKLDGAALAITVRHLQ